MCEDFQPEETDCPCCANGRNKLRPWRAPLHFTCVRNHLFKLTLKEGKRVLIAVADNEVTYPKGSEFPLD